MPGLLNVQSEPAGAQLFVNNALKGRTPLKLELPPGQYEIRMDLSGYYNWEAQIELDEAGEIPLFIELIQEE
jgi:hypothetical protein